MGRTGLGLGLAMTALVLGACGAATPPGDPGQTLVAASPGPSPSEFGAGGGRGTSTEPLTGPTFPLTLRRTGGIAGFDDTVVLQANGQVLVDTRSVHGRLCTLTGPQQRQLIMTLSTLRLGGPVLETPEPTEPTDPAGGPGDSEPTDRISISITDVDQRPVDLSDPSLGEVSGMVGSLVTDVTLSTPAATKCTTPTAPTPAPPA